MANSPLIAVPVIGLCDAEVRNCLRLFAYLVILSLVTCALVALSMTSHFNHLQLYQTIFFPISDYAVIHFLVKISNPMDDKQVYPLSAIKGLKTCSFKLTGKSIRTGNRHLLIPQLLLS